MKQGQALTDAVTVQIQSQRDFLVWTVGSSDTYALLDTACADIIPSLKLSFNSLQDSYTYLYSCAQMNSFHAPKRRFNCREHVVEVGVFFLVSA